MKMRSTLPLSKTLEAKVFRVARRLRKSPRVVLDEAVEEYMSRHDAKAVTAAMNRVADAIDTRPESAFSAAAGGILKKTEW
jgi:predicted transcriptional regulator